MPATRDELERSEQAYRRSRRTVLGHVVFLGVCCTAAFLLRRTFRLPSIFLFTVFVVALLAFAGDIMKFLHCRHELHRQRVAGTPS